MYGVVYKHGRAQKKMLAPKKSQVVWIILTLNFP